MEAENKKSSAFEISQGDIDDILRSGSGVQGGKYRIVLQYQRHESNKLNAAFLKKEYGTGGRVPALRDKNISEGHNPKGLTLTVGSLLEPDAEINLSWTKVATRIGLLIEADRYLTQAEKEYLPHYEEDEEKRRQEYLGQLEAERADPDRVNADYVVSTGDRVYLDGIEYEITDMDEQSVLICDPSFPILSNSLSLDDFDKQVRLSPYNDRYISDNAPVYKVNEVVQDVSSEAPGEEQEHDSFDDINTISIRERLEKAGIVNGVVVDPEALDNDPFIRQVTADAERIAQEEQVLTLNDQPISRVNDTITTGEGGDYHEIDITVTDQEYEVIEKALPKVPETAAVSFRITDNQLGVGGPKAKYAANIAAIKTLKVVESQNRRATAEEQAVLSRYVGWGGVSQAFDEKNTSWSKEYAELKELLADQEYAAARESTLTAFYTPPVIIKAMYKALADMGFKTGNIIDPGCGDGNFIGLLPESMSSSHFYGVEIDAISGRITQQLYQNASITIDGFEKTQLPDSFFDLAIGNVPFGQYKVADRKYDKYNFLIHDYFFAKTLDKVRPGGLIAFITSSGTMDKQNASVRRYIAQRAELIGAVRLPNNAFKANAGTEVVADILFLQKRDHMIDTEPEWTQLDRTPEGFLINRYFVEHPEMVLGTLKEESTQFGMDVTCAPIKDADLADQLQASLSNLNASFSELDLEQELEHEAEQDEVIPADPATRNFSYCLHDGSIYYRENSLMTKQDLGATPEKRIRGMIEIRDCLRTMIDEQLEGCSDDVLEDLQQKLHALYDNYVKSYDRLNSRGNKLAFEYDSSYPLLCALEIFDDEGNFEAKSDIFSKRTIRQEIEITHVDTAAEALAVCIGEKARVDLSFMSDLLDGMDEQAIADALQGVIFLNPESNRWEMADEYLSGNVRLKLIAAEHYNELYGGVYAANVAALEAAQPKDLKFNEIDVRLGATWIEPKYIKQFMLELFDISSRKQQNMDVKYSPHTDSWHIEGIRYDPSGTAAYITYGTKRKNGYELLQDALNLRSSKVYDTIENADGGETRVLNGKETVLAQQKQDLIKSAFKDWIFRDIERREILVRKYNDTFNAIAPRHYDGSHIRFVGMNPEIKLRKHQLDAVARALYGGNALLAHCVGAGKTYTMAAIAMESKRLGLCNKSIFVVPNHLIQDWCGEFLRLYPSAKLLMTTEKDFQTANRKKFCARIATGDYDAVIIGHSQFERIPISAERQEAQLNRQIDEISLGIEQVKEENGERFTIKQMESLRKQLENKLEKLSANEKKDGVVTFEELGVDKLLIDEADGYKNLFLFSKMRNVVGISQTAAQKSTDMFNKCQYLDELTDGKGVVFATGTPVSNSICELYTMMRYLQYRMLERMQLTSFDAWASTFGEVVTSMELAPEGTTYRMKSRFARFYNLPELMNMWREAADIQTADMLKLPVPHAEYHTEVVDPTEIQRGILKELVKRAVVVRDGGVDPSQDNMLTITNDGRNMALDQRLFDPTYPDEPDTKVNRCVENIFRIWQDTATDRSTQLVFCDISTPGKIKMEMVEDVAVMAKFQNIYEDIHSKLIARGIPDEEIAFIHDAKTQVKKAALFSRVRTGSVRILLGSTAKMGAGTNVQKLLRALHELDVPWRPRDVEQREGRAIRQGNTNPVVDIYRYVTKDTFDAYNWQTIEIKQKFIGQIMTGKSPLRNCEDVDSTALSFSKLKELATGDPYINEKMNLDNEIVVLNALRTNHRNEQGQLEERVLKTLPAKIQQAEQAIQYLSADNALAAQTADSAFLIELEGKVYTDKALAMETVQVLSKLVEPKETRPIGSYRGFALELSVDEINHDIRVKAIGKGVYSFSLGSDAKGNVARLNNLINKLPESLERNEDELKNLKNQLETSKASLGVPFPQEQELQEKTARLNELNVLLYKNHQKRELENDLEMEA